MTVRSPALQFAVCRPLESLHNGLDRLHLAFVLAVSHDTASSQKAGNE